MTDIKEWEPSTCKHGSVRFPLYDADPNGRDAYCPVCKVLELTSSCAALRARIVELEEQVRMRDEVATALEKERNVYKDFINGYGSFPCHPDCDTISHSDQCPRVDIPLAFKTLQEENKRLREAGEELRAIVHQEAEYIDVDNLTTQTKYARYRNAVSSWLKEG